MTTPANRHPGVVRLSRVLLGVAPLLGAGAGDGATDDSLESILRQVRAEQAALFRRLEPTVRDLVRRLEERPERSDLGDLRAELDALGPEAAPLLLPHLDPGPNPDRGLLQRSQEIAGALMRAPSAAVTDELVKLARNGSDEGRLRAVLVLGHSPDKERAGIELRDLYGPSTGPLRLALVRALADLGGPKDILLLRSSLGDPDDEILRAVLDALTAAQDAEAAPALMEVLEQPARAGAVAAELVAYYAASPGVVDEEVLFRLAQLATRSTVEVDARILLLEAIPTFEAARGTRLRKVVEKVQDSENTDLREAGHVCLTLLGDRGAKKELLRTYDEIVDANEDWPDAYEHRADVLMRIREYSDAARDYQRALDLLSSRASQGTYRRIWINLARSYVKGGKLRQAHDTLRELGLSSTVVDLVKGDDDFAPLLAHPRYGKDFG